MGGLSDATGVLCNPVTAKVTKPRFSGFPGDGKGLIWYVCSPISDAALKAACTLRFRPQGPHTIQITVPCGHVMLAR